MLYILMTLVFFVAAILMLFAKDSFINIEFANYQRILVHPYLNRIALNYYHDDLPEK